MLGFESVTYYIRRLLAFFVALRAIRVLCSSCCQFRSNRTHLFACLSELSHRRESWALDNIYEGGGPTMGVGVVTFATDNILDYALYSIAVNLAFASYNGYIMRFITNTSTSFDKYDDRWNKVKILEEALDPEVGWARDLDYILWVDADMIIMDMNLRIEQIAARHPKAHILISAEHAGSTTLINSGAILVRNTPWSRRFLSSWWTFADRRLYSDQEQFDMLYTAKRREWAVDRRIAILAPNALNSDPPAMTQQKPQDPVLHLMGEHTMFRQRVFKSAFDEICRVVAVTAAAYTRSRGILSGPSASGHRGGNDEQMAIGVELSVRSSHLLPESDRESYHFPAGEYQYDNDDDSFQYLQANLLAPQLTATRENLLLWTLQEYSAEVYHTMDIYNRAAESGSNDLVESRRLSNAIHHFAHAMMFSTALEREQWRKSFRVAVLTAAAVALSLPNLPGESSSVSPSAYDEEEGLACSNNSNNTGRGYEEIGIDIQQATESAAQKSTTSDTTPEETDQICQQQQGESTVTKQAESSSSLSLSPSSFWAPFLADDGDAVSGPALAVMLRRRTYELMHTNLQNRRPLNAAFAASNNGRVFENWPELLKVVVESGQHLLVVGDAPQRRKIASEVLVLLDEILQVCHKLQRPAVMHMVAHVYTELGKICMDDNQAHPAIEDRAQEALQWFQKSMRIAEDLAKQSGEHSLVSPMMLVATTLSVLHQYQLSLPMFRRAIVLAERHLGETHDSLAQMLLNYGVACFEHGEYYNARVALSRVLSVLRSNGYLTTATTTAGSNEGASQTPAQTQAQTNTQSVTDTQLHTQTQAETRQTNTQSVTDTQTERTQTEEENIQVVVDVGINRKQQSKYKSVVQERAEEYLNKIEQQLQL